jgi:hypothetical protein
MRFGSQIQPAQWQGGAAALMIPVNLESESICAWDVSVIMKSNAAFLRLHSRIAIHAARPGDRHVGSEAGKRPAWPAGSVSELTGGIVSPPSKFIEGNFVAQIPGNVPPQTGPGPGQKTPGDGTQ